MTDRNLVRVPARGQSYHLTTFGCQMNQADSQRLRGLLASMGYAEAATPEAANLVIFNTCCVRDHAENRLFARIEALRPVKRRRPDLVIAVAGCIAQKDRTGLFTRQPLIDLVFGPNDLETLPELLLELVASGRASGGFAPVGRFDGDRADGIVLERPFAALVNIVRGCSNWCSYCIVPAVRGPEVSRPLPEVVGFVRELVARGVREITLLGQNVNVYGRDLGMQGGFLQLVEALGAIDGLWRIRFLTSHPRDFDGATIARLLAAPRVCPQLHLPLQSGCDRILALMNRGYDRAHYRQLVQRARAACPDLTLSTDIICGFPSETEAEFQETLDFVEEIGFDSVFTYYYSPRPGTRAVELPGLAPEEERKARLDRLITCQNRLGSVRSAAWIGRVVTVLVERAATRVEGHVLGTTAGGRVVDFPGDVGAVGTLAKVKITMARNFTLSGVPVAG